MVMAYIPDHGDLVYLEFDTQAGHEQKGKRPALVVSNKTFNQFTKLTMVCPITNTQRNYPLHITLDSRTKTTGVIMCEQVKSLDLNARKATFFERIPDDILAEVLDILNGFIEIENN